MRIEGVGLVVLLLGFAGWGARPAFAIHILVIATLLGASAAIILTGVGGANIMPANLLLGFLAISFPFHKESRTAMRALEIPNEGFWLVLTAVYGAVTALVLPRLFAGAIDVFPVARSGSGGEILLTALAPSAGNITQTVYFIGDVLCFLMIYAYASRPAGVKSITDAILWCAVVNLLFALADIATYATHTEALLSIIRNANYRMLDDTAIIGFKRIVGSFPEASSFAYATVGLFAFCARLYLGRIYPLLSGTLALLSLIALAFATSSTGYFGTCAVLGGLYLASLWRVLTRPIPKATLAIIVIAPLILAAGIIALRLDAPLWTVIGNMIDKTITNKLASASGEERALWNAQAWRAFLATGGLGGGIGSMRASSFPVAVLSSIGVIGALTYGAFLQQVLFRRRRRWEGGFAAECQSAARWACFGQLAAASVAGSFIDLALPFFIFAGLACAGPELRRAAPSTAPHPVAGGSLATEGSR